MFINEAQLERQQVETAFNLIIEGVAAHLAKDNKTIGEPTTIDIALDDLKMHLPHDGWEIEEVSPFGAVLLYSNEGDYISMPAGRWRRQSEYLRNDQGQLINNNGELLGEDEGPVIVDAHARPADSREAEETEISFLALESDTPEQAAVLADEYLSDLIKTHDAVLKGPEFEFSLMGDNLSTVMPKDEKELSRLQRETGLEPANGSFDLRVFEHIAQTLATAERQGVAVNYASTHPEKVDFSQPQNQVVDHPYVRAVTAALDEYNIKPNLDLLPDAVRDAWEQAAESLGFESVKDMTSQYKHMDYWISNCFHTSNDQPVYPETLKGSETIFKNTSNLFIYFRNVMDSLCYSGGDTFGTRITHEDEVVDDSRALLRNLMPTSMPANLLETDFDVRRQMVTAIAEGETNTYDRASANTTVSNNGREKTFMNLHGDVRWRVAVPFKNYVAFRKAMDMANSQEAYPDLSDSQRRDLKKMIADKFGGAVRVEYTSRPSTPDMRKYLQSAAIQEVLFTAGVLASRDGYNDVFKWLRDHELVRTPYEGFEVTNTQTQYEEMLRSLHGEYPHHKLQMFEGIMELVDKKMTGYYGQGYSPLVMAMAQAGIDSLTDNDRRIAQKEKPAIERFRTYLYDSTSESNWGALVNSLSTEDIAHILEGDFKVKLDQDLSRGRLVIMLNHCVTSFTCAAYGIN